MVHSQWQRQKEALLLFFVVVVAVLNICYLDFDIVSNFDILISDFTSETFTRFRLLHSRIKHAGFQPYRLL